MIAQLKYSDGRKLHHMQSWLLSSYLLQWIFFTVHVYKAIPLESTFIQNSCIIKKSVALSWVSTIIYEQQVYGGQMTTQPVI